jgi:HlyD family secretion protein
MSAGNMDIVRASQSKKRKRLLAAIAVVAGLIITTVAFARLRPAAPAIERSNVIVETVRRGPMTREVRASGVLVPENIRWIAAATDARVERIVVQPGTAVSADTVLIELSDPQQQQSTRDAEWQLRAAEAAYAAAEAELESDRLDREASAARIRADHEQARLRAEADAELERAGLVANITRKISQSNANELGRRVQIESQRLASMQQSQRARLAALRAEVEQRRAMFELQQQQREALQVRAGIDGVLQQVSVQVGQRVGAGTNIARVAQPDRLKAEVRVPETQAKDIAVGQSASIDTRNGIVRARVARVDPAVREGTVTVDLAIEGPLPAGARPDLTVDAVIELERIPDAVQVARPVGIDELSAGNVYRVENNGEAHRVRVDFGRASATAIEIRSGLQPGDQVIVSDDAAYERHERVKLK